MAIGPHYHQFNDKLIYAQKNFDSFNLQSVKHLIKSKHRIQNKMRLYIGTLYGQVINNYCKQHKISMNDISVRLFYINVNLFKFYEWWNQKIPPDYSYTLSYYWCMISEVFRCLHYSNYFAVVTYKDNLFVSIYDMQKNNLKDKISDHISRNNWNDRFKITDVKDLITELSYTTMTSFTEAIIFENCHGKFLL